MAPSESPSIDDTALALRRPLRFRRVCVEKVWGGRSLESTPGFELDVRGPVGETWELVDREDQNSIVADGPLAGRSLHELMESASSEILGRSRPGPAGRFPLLLKYISAHRPLSVQVHPDDETARRLGAGESGKSECWYILAAGEKSVVYLGLAPGVDEAAFAAHAGEPEIVDLIQPHRVRAGQFVMVPAGTLHAIGEDVILFEIQQNSDLTFRLYDWGRKGLDEKPRETHLDQGLLAIRYEDEGELVGPITPELEPRGVGNRGVLLADNEFFRVELLELSCSMELDTDNRAIAYAWLEGEGRITMPAADETWSSRAGDTWLIPASVGVHRIEPGSGELRLLRVETRG